MGNTQQIIVTFGLLAVVFAAVIATNPAVLPILFPMM